MKRLMILAILLFAGTAWGSPFLVCTPDPVVTNYLIKVNGANAIELPAPLHWNLEPMANGTYNLEVAAKNMWGISTYVPFDFVKKVPANPLGIGLSAD